MTFSDYEAIAAEFYLQPIAEFAHETRDWYVTFLCQTDYISAKAMDAMVLGESIEDYRNVLLARKWCREQINAIDNGTYVGPEAGTDIHYYIPDFNDLEVEG